VRQTGAEEAALVGERVVEALSLEARGLDEVRYGGAVKAAAPESAEGTLEDLPSRRIRGASPRALSEIGNDRSRTL
jgi:hypothetical protein